MADNVLKEFRSYWGGDYQVEINRDFEGWQFDTSWETKEAAYYAAEKLSKEKRVPTRVTVITREESL